MHDDTSTSHARAAQAFGRRSPCSIPGETSPFLPARDPLLVAEPHSCVNFRTAAFAPLPSNLSWTVGKHSKILDHHDLGRRIPVKGTPDINLLGQAVHAFMAATARTPTSLSLPLRGDNPPSLPRVRIPRSSLHGPIGEPSQSWLDARFHGARVRRELLVHAVLGTRTLVGRIDLLVQGTN